MNKKILHWPEMALRKKTKPIDPATYSDYSQLVKDMIDTCNVAMGAGLAANQIGSDISAFVVQPKVLGSANPDPSDENPDFMVCFNPVWTPAVNANGQYEVEQWTEGCLSLPGLDMKTTRSSKGVLYYIDQHGQENNVIIEFPLSAAIEHEMDHLNGKTIAHVNRKAGAASLTLSFWKKKRQKMAKKAK